MAFQAGLAAEERVRDHLITNGFTSLRERYKTKHGEIDLIMKRGTLIVFIEVKARASVHDGLHAISPRAQRRISDSAAQWISEHPQSIDTDFRFDVAVVTPDNHVTILENAFDASQTS